MTNCRQPRLANRVVSHGAAVLLLLLLGNGSVTAAPPVCPTPGQGYEIAGCFSDTGGDEFPAGGTVEVYDLAFGETLSESFSPGTFVVDAFLVSPPSTPPAACNACGSVDFCVVVTFNPVPAGTPAPQTLCADGDSTVNDGGFDLRSLAGGQPLVVTVPGFTVGGTVTGLEGSGLTLQNNGTDDLAIADDGPFTFIKKQPAGSAYAVTVLTQPASPTQECTVNSGSGILADTDFTGVDIVCETLTADLSVSKSVDPETFIAGAPLSYIITVSNAGPEEVTGARIEDTLPQALSNATWTCQADTGAACPASGTGDLNETVDLPPGSSVSFTLTAMTPSDFEGVIVNEARVSPPETITDPDMSNNSAIVSSASMTLFQDDFEN